MATFICCAIIIAVRSVRYISPSRNWCGAAYGLRNIVATGEYVFQLIRNPRDNLASSFDFVVIYYMTDAYGFLRALDVPS